MDRIWIIEGREKASLSAFPLSLPPLLATSTPYLVPLASPLPFYSTFSSLSAFSSIFPSSSLFLIDTLAPLSSFYLLHSSNLYFPSSCYSDDLLCSPLKSPSINCQINLSKAQREAVGTRYHDLGTSIP